MARQTVDSLRDGDGVEEVFLVAERSLRSNRNADLYLLTQLRDRTGVISGLKWNVTEQAVAGVTTGAFVRVKGKVQNYNGRLQVIMARVDAVPADGLDPDEFRPAGEVDADRLFARLTELLAPVATPTLRAVADAFLGDEALKTALAGAPAGVKAHHAHPAGLLAHTVSMLEVVTRIEPCYPDVDFDLVKLGVLLHDIGKTRELSYGDAFAYTDEGQLVGHIVIGCEMLTEKVLALRAGGVEIDDAAVTELKHLILSHHGTIEHGAVRLPMTPEAVVLHHVDCLDAKVHEFLTVVAEDPNADDRWTPFHPRLGRKLYKRPVGRSSEQGTVNREQDV
ncbi:MAG: HD domain-containing protein [Planctomycetota bacterium]